ncbi:hypothetical protein MASR2M15_04270 [Anaerolineales bacterium]
MSNTSKRLSMFLGIILAASMVLSAVLPLLSTLTQSQVAPLESSPTPMATLVPAPAISDINFDEKLLHPSGIYHIAIPSGWETIGDYNTSAEAQLSLRNTEALSIIETRLLTPLADTEINGLEDLDNYFTKVWLDQSWRGYGTVSETNRKIEGDKHIIDFSLSQGNQEFIARQAAWYEAPYIYMVRVVAPSTSNAMIPYLIENMAENFKINEAYADAPLDWDGNFDSQSGLMIRRPSTWLLQDGVIGSAKSFVGDKVLLRVETLEGSIADEEAARQWVSDWRKDAEVLSVETYSNNGQDGYLVSYTAKTVDGDPVSGLVSLLNGSNGHLHISKMSVPNVSVDILTDESGLYADLVNTGKSMAEFSDYIVMEDSSEGE